MALFFFFSLLANVPHSRLTRFADEFSHATRYDGILQRKKTKKNEEKQTHSGS